MSCMARPGEPKPKRFTPLRVVTWDVENGKVGRGEPVPDVMHGKARVAAAARGPAVLHDRLQRPPLDELHDDDMAPVLEERLEQPRHEASVLVRRRQLLERRHLPSAGAHV